MLKTSYTTRNAVEVAVQFPSMQAAVERLAVLDAKEAQTRAIMPTDTGDVRDNYIKESMAIRKLITPYVKTHWGIAPIIEIRFQGRNGLFSVEYGPCGGVNGGSGWFLEDQLVQKPE